MNPITLCTRYVDACNRHDARRVGDDGLRSVRGIACLAQRDRQCTCETRLTATV